MRNISLLIFGLTFIALPVQAQHENIRKKIDKVYPNRSYQEYLYLVSPQSRSIDNWQEQQYHDFFKEEKPSMENARFISPDTTFVYEEVKNYESETFIPSSFSRRYSVGDTTNWDRYNNSYTWIASSNQWLPRSLSRSLHSDGKLDSIINHYHNSWNGDYLYSQKSIYPEEPAYGADTETYIEVKNPAYYGDSLWYPARQQLQYKDENGQDTLYQEYVYYEDTDELGLNYEYRSEFTETRTYYRYDYFNNGTPTQYVINETTEDYILYEDKQFNGDDITQWDYGYTKLGEGRRYLYQFNKRYNVDEMQLIPVDSTNFEYLDNNTRIVSDYYLYPDTAYVWDQQRVSYQTETGENTYLVDSVKVISIRTNEETQERELDRVQIMSTFEYNQSGRQTAVNTFQIINDSLQQVSRTETDYQLVNDFETIVAVRTFRRDVESEDLYLYSDIKYDYEEDGFYSGYSQVYFDAAGDTTSANVIQREFLPDFSFFEVSFQWDNATKELQLSGLRVVNRTIRVEESGIVNQEYVTVNINARGEYVSRNLISQLGYPGIFNDGPIQVNQGDTLQFIVSAINPDLTVPEVEVTNMPSSATFDPETREFFWVVDEDDPQPMTYTAIRGEKSVTTDVVFLTEGFTVSSESGDEPVRFELSQNYPNPFNPSTNIQFSLPEAGIAKLSVYNLLGQEVATLLNERMTAGTHAVSFDAGNLASGVYIYRLTSGSFIQTKKMMLIK